MRDTRHKDARWIVPTDEHNRITWDGIHAAILMDIRDELKLLNSLLRCPNFTEIPRTLTAIKRNTTKPKRRKT